MTFEPQVNDLITIHGAEYYFTQLAMASFEIVHAVEAGQATTFRIANVLNPKDQYALKVFKYEYRNRRVAISNRRLVQLASVPGLVVCKRVVIESERDCPQLFESEDLRYAVLMPWIAGQTWFDVLQIKMPSLDRSTCLKLALQMSKVLAGLEGRGLAHCDVASGNVIFDLKEDKLELIDVEDMFASGIERPANLPKGSPGYQHKNTAREGAWCPEADRFAGAVMLAEMLSWHENSIRELAQENSFFASRDMQTSSARYQALAQVLRSAYSADIEKLFQSAWFSSSLQECPTMSRWLAMLENLTERERPRLFVIPQSLDFGDIARAPVVRSFEVRNAGSSKLQVNIAPLDCAWLSVTPKAFELAPNGSRAVEVTACAMETPVTPVTSHGYLQVHFGPNPIFVAATARLMPQVQWFERLANDNNLILGVIVPFIGLSCLLLMCVCMLLAQHR